MCDGDWLGKPQPHVSLKSYAVVKNRDVKYVWKGKVCWEASVIVPRPAPCPPVTAVCCLADALAVRRGRPETLAHNESLCSFRPRLGFQASGVPKPPRWLRCLVWD